jgi:integrase
MTVNVRKYRGAKHLIDVRVTFPDGTSRRDRRVIGSVTRAQAKAWGGERERELLARHGKVDSPAFDAFADEWLATYPASANNSPTTIRGRTGHIATHLKPYFGSTTLDRIDRKMLDLFVVQLFKRQRGKPDERRVRKVGTGPRPITARTVAHVLSTLGKMLRTAVEWGSLETMPKLPRVKVSDSGFAYYDRDEAARLLAAAPDLESRALLMFALHTGARAGEQLAVRVGDLDLVTGQVTFSRSTTRGVVRESTKSGRVRPVLLTETLQDMLRDMLARRAVRSLDGDELVFAHADGRPLALHDLHRTLRRAARRAELRRLRWHDLRHSYASILTGGGCPIRQVQTWLGHSTLGMTMRYSHLAPGGGREHLAALEPESTKAIRRPRAEGNAE